MAELIKILLVDDSQIHLTGLRIFLEKDKSIKIIGEAHNPEEAKSIIKRSRPNVILLDISLEEETDGIDLADYLRKEEPGINILILSHYREVKYVMKALKARVRGYISKDVGSDELIYAIHSINNGKGIFLCESLPYEKLIDYFGSEENLLNNKQFALTQREIEIIKKMADGYSTKEIAALLKINKTTVESHKENIKEKLNKKTVIEIVVFAIKNHIIEL